MKTAENKNRPARDICFSMDEWIREAKKDENAARCGMYLFHNGVVREDARAKVREGRKNTAPVKKLQVSYDEADIEKAVKETEKQDGIYYVRVQVNQGILNAGEDIMYVLIGGDIRTNVIKALDYLVGRIKGCIKEKELFD